MHLEGKASLVPPDTLLSDAIPLMLRNRCRCLMVGRERVEATVSLMQIVRRLAREWMKGRPPHEVIREMRIGDLKLHPPLLYPTRLEPIDALIEMLTHNVNFILTGDGEIYTVLDALVEMTEYLRGEVVGSVVAAQRWWAVSPRLPVREAFLHVSMLPTWRVVLVNEMGGVEGLFSATDFLRALLEGETPYEEPVSMLATPSPYSADYDESLVTIVRIMYDNDVHVMPVLRGIEGFTGVTHAYDIARLAAIKVLRRPRG